MNNKVLSGLSRWQKYILGYALLLIASHLVILIFNQPIQEEQTVEKSVTAQVVQADSLLADRQTEIHYQDIYTGSKQNPATLVLLPGGPEGPDVFEELIRDLSSQYRLVIPHLPGYNNGKNNRDLPDYSFSALAVYASQLLDKLGISEAHFVGYGLGGASAVYFAHNWPHKIQSLSLISSIGVQELELLGSYRLNHAVHGLQLGAVWVLYNAVPHFGLMDFVGINVSYAKSHYESDQRPIRGYLKEFTKPMLILHGRDDPLVPLAAAKEHHRIVPQSELSVFDADHDLIETHSDSVRSSLSAFISDVEAGTALTADQAPDERIAEAKKPFSNINFQKFEGISLLIIMLIIIFSTFISEDLTCIGAGLLAARGLIGFWPATVACFIGIFVGDIGLYLIGRFVGRPAVRRAPLKWMISERDLNKSAEWFKVRGPAIIIASRFLPGSRLPTYLSAGIIGAGFWMFTAYFLLAAVIWTPMLVGISKLLGNELIRYFSMYQDYALWVFLGAIVFLVMLVKVILPVFSYKGRRLLVSRYRRLTRWEYWSPLILYAPVFCYVIYLGIKNRCLTLFTATNPAIPDGGFVGESKTEILELFDQSDIAPYITIAHETDREVMKQKAQHFMQEHDLEFPIVLKPDIGERGKGVRVIRNEQMMEQYLVEAEKDIIIQEHISGDEFGIFYYRLPNEEKGSIFSITRKQLLEVTGDGKKTIEELILADNRTVSLAKFHLRKNQDRLYEVPEEGESIPIVELGTHARGAIFGEGKLLITDELIAAMNRICDSASGFFFGRFDIKAPSPDKLKKGRQLTVLEANGVSSESTNIYDAQYSFWDAQRVLMEQWALAFEIGYQNKERGMEPTPALTLLKHIFHALKKE